VDPFIDDGAVVDDSVSFGIKIVFVEVVSVRAFSKAAGFAEEIVYIWIVM
jgi:hypothetical protein